MPHSGSSALHGVENQKKKVILSKKVELTEICNKPTDVYHSFQELCQRISKLKLSVGWSINISEFAYIKNLTIFMIYRSLKLLWT